jgi:biopolymer transport protein ExbB/TolQ
MTISKKFMTLTASICLGVGITLISVMGYKLTGGMTGTGTANRLFVLLGGNFLAGGYIQFFTYIAFFWSLFDIIQKRKKIKREVKCFRKSYLPTNERHLLMANDINDLQFKMGDLEKVNKTSLLSVMIKKACTKFRTTKSIPEVIEIISIQTEINKEKAESGQSNIRYLTWVIPSIGFIGTVLGISQALMVANSGDMNIITSTLGVAFDTTLISLVLSIIVMWFFHGLQEETDNLHAGIKEYVIENLVNRIEI